jgi:2-desacetyl-2-hydroxyethyl bacteriochlorophyllide A dehydrogenase
MRRVLNIHGVDDVRLDKVDMPSPGKSDVVVKVKACGICGSDLSYIKWGGINRQPGGTTPIGHEAAGEIVFAGDAVKDVKVGQRVAINPMNTPSFIGSGGPEGAFADEVLVRDARVGDSLLPISEEVPYEIAALAEPLAVALHGVNRAQAKPGDKVVVFGCGPIGLGMVLWLADRGVKSIVALDLTDERLARAKALGAHATINPTREDVRARLLELHGKERTLTRDAVGTDAFIDAAGSVNILNDVVGMAKLHARMVVTAAYNNKPVQIDLGAMLTTEMSITTACGYPTEMTDVVAALPRLRDKLKSLISHRYPFDKVIEALGVAGTSKSAKVMIDF